MENLLEKIEQTATFLSAFGFTDLQTGIVLGTGLGSFIDEIEIEKSLPYHEIPNFPLSTVESHKGRLLLGCIGNKRVIVMQGRFHYYEGYSMQEITFPVRVMKALGIRSLLLSNAAGGMNPAYKKGDIILLDDHINLLPENPLRGLNDAGFGNRFVDMSCPYSRRLNDLLLQKAVEQGVHLKKGIYVAVMGPNLETRAEYRYLRAAGADMVGMSTVPEVIVANHLGLECAALSVITDECDPDNLSPISIEEIIQTAGQADKVLSRLLRETVKLV
jgi:purine-nucleoside phosphorylase